MYDLYEQGCDWLGNKLCRLGWSCIRVGMRLSGVAIDEWLAEQASKEEGE